MNQLLEKLLLKDKIEYKGSIKDLKKKINESKGRKFNVEWLSDNEFKFLAKWSSGTFIISSGIFSQHVDQDGIKGYGKIKKQNNEKIEIHLTTNFRIELYFIFGASVIFFIASFFIKEILPFSPLGFLLLLPLILFISWGTYRIQESLLFKIFKQHLINERG